MDIIMLHFEDWLAGIGIAEAYIPLVKVFTLLLLLSALSYAALIITKQVIVRILHTFISRTDTKWDDVFMDNKVFFRLAHIVPALVVKLLAPMFFIDFIRFEVILMKATDVYLILAFTMALMAVIRSVEQIARQWTVFKDRPVNSYMQVVRIVLYILAGILVLSVILGRSPLYFLSAFGAFTAIILLVFKDTILGLVASVQMTANDTVRVGDWVEMPKFNADGDVIEINLNTVKIQNWDRTISSVPTYYFMTDSFKNWRGMSQGGGRRIKRAMFINLRSVKFVDPEMRERMKGYDLIRDFVTNRQAEIEAYNAEKNVNTAELINGRRMTNLGVFRQYALAYIQTHSMIRDDMTVMVRQLPHDERGLPLEVYCFTSTTAWVDYERIQSDIFDHLFAAASYFDLEIFQAPSGNDVRLLGETLAASR